MIIFSCLLSYLGVGNLQNVKRYPKSRLDVSTEGGKGNDGLKILTSNEQEMQNDLYPHVEHHEYDGITDLNRRLRKRWYDRLVRQMYDRLARSNYKRLSSGFYDRLARRGFDRLARMAYDRLARSKYDRLAKAKYGRLIRATIDSSQKEAFGFLNDLPTPQVVVHSNNEGWYPRLRRSRKEANDDQDNLEAPTMENKRKFSRLMHRMMRSGDLHRMMHSNELHRMIRSGDLHRMMRSDEFHRMMRSSDLYRMMRSMDRIKSHCLNGRMAAEIDANDDKLSEDNNEAGYDNESDDVVVDLEIDNVLGEKRLGRSAFDRLMRSNIKYHDKNGKLGHQIGLIPIDDENRAWEMVDFLSRN